MEKTNKYYDIDGKEITKEEFEEILKNNGGWSQVGYDLDNGIFHNYIIKN